MLARVGIGLVLLLALPAGGQENQTAGSPMNLEAQMLTPPPISGLDYSTTLSSERHFNYLNTSIAAGAGYIHNLRPGSLPVEVNDTIFVFQSSVAFNRSTSRSEQTFSFNPAFALYQPTSVLNNLNQDASVDLRFHLTPHTSLRTSDTFDLTSASFGAGNSPVTIPSSPESVTPGVLAPYAPEMTNRASAAFSWQSARSDMLAASGLLSTLDFTDPSRAQGFYNSSNRSGSVSYTHRLTDDQYAGTIGEYSRINATPLRDSAGAHQSDTRSASAFGFFTVYFQPRLSLSLVGGSQHYDLTELSVIPAHAWFPAGMASIAWQDDRTSVAVSGSHIITSGYGMIGAYETNSGAAGARWRCARTWTVGIDGNYSKLAAVASRFANDSMRGGQSDSATFSLDHAINNNLNFSVAYTRLHQIYSGIAAISGNPESDNVTISLAYHLSRPLGR